MNLTILYRGPLSSCNYDCDYCPFAKHHETAAELAVDRRALGRFAEWVTGRKSDQLSIFFTPWGEALTRRWYRQALAQLTNLAHVRKVAIQTNLSCRLEWTESCDTTKLGLWCTYHPLQVSRERFLGRCRELDQRDVAYSVGVVGLREHFEEIEALRRELAPQTYLWINAFKGQDDYYREEDVRRLEAVDPLFRTNTIRHPSLGRSCRSGQSVISVDGEGNIRRCHFIKQVIGNIYQPGFEACLFDRPCTNPTCGCHIGYVHLDDLNLYDVYGTGLLERIPRPEVFPAAEEPMTPTRRHSPSFGSVPIR